MQSDHQDNGTPFNACCCCGPYPSLDLTKAFNINGDDEHLKDLKNEAIAACERFGCFHVTISPAELGNDWEFMKILGDENAVKQSFVRFFDDNFIRCQTRGNAIASVPYRTRDGSTTAAKYRGRAAESGSTIGLEPKQSWEVFRCQKVLSHAASEPCNELSILHDYVRVLHEVAVCLFSKVLELPAMFIDDNACECDCTHNNDCSCTMDLLRAFQYDALKSSDIAAANLGSSPHTDWGSLTVVWQDSKGGLQIYCHEHEKWNNVQASDDIGDGTVRLFIHVGDFTSLALSQALSSPEQVTWPSPLHRVLCPLQSDGTDGKGENDARRSLVYFAYPPKGSSLDDSQRYVRNKMGAGKEELNKVGLSSFPYDRYMVLNDQSPGSGIASSKEEVYHRIKKIPFHKVIEAKWQEVQRT